MPAISSIAGSEDLLEPVRLAPSATNSQPWFFSGDAAGIIVSRKKLNLVKAALYDKVNQIDIGIALFHLWLSADRQGKKVSFDYKELPVPVGYEFMVKALIG